MSPILRTHTRPTRDLPDFPWPIITWPS